MLPIARQIADALEAAHEQGSRATGHPVLWGAELGEIFYRQGQTIMRAGVSTIPNFVPATPSVLCGTNLMPDAGGIQYALAPDGKRFILIKSHASGDVRSEPRVALNWFDEARTRAPRRQQGMPPATDS